MQRIFSQDLIKLKELEKKLKCAQRSGSVEDAESAMKHIQILLKPYRDHHRLLECRLWYFETLLDANQVALAESGFFSIRTKASPKTRLHLEATFFLALCYVRQRRFKEAKNMLREVFTELNKEKIAPTRRLLQKRVIDRLEEESILAELIGSGSEPMSPEKIQLLAVEMVKKPEDEVLELLGRNIPYEAYRNFQTIREHAILQISISDRKLLAPPGFATKELNVGKRVFSGLKRIGWNTLCDVKSPIYKMWSKKVPEIYGAGYFSAAIVQAFNNWKIGFPFLAAGVIAIAMRYGAEEFCSATKPDSIMEIRRKR